MADQIIYLRKDGHQVRRLVGPHREVVAAQRIAEGWERFAPPRPFGEPLAAEPVPDASAPVGYQEMTVPALRDAIAARGLDAPARARKAELIAILEGADQDADAATDQDDDDADTATEDAAHPHDRDVAGAALARAPEDAAVEES